MAISTLTKGQINTAIRARGIDGTELDGTQLEAHIRWGLQDLNNLLPKYVKATLTLVADQQEYTLPDAVRTLVRVYYSPCVSNSDPADLRSTEFYYPSQAIQWDERYSSLLGDRQGGWDVRDEGTSKVLVLYPSPDTSFVSTVPTVPYIYTANRVITDVPADWEGMLVDAVMAHIYNTLSLTGGNEVSFKDAGVEIRTGNNPREMAARHIAAHQSFLRAARAKQKKFPTARSARTGWMTWA